RGGGAGRWWRGCGARASGWSLWYGGSPGTPMRRCGGPLRGCWTRGCSTGRARWCIWPGRRSPTSGGTPRTRKNSYGVASTARGCWCARSGRRSGGRVSARGVDVDGDPGDRVVDESEPKGTGFLPELCGRWEAEAAAAEDAGVRVARLRTGIVLSGRGGALRRMLPVFKAGLGAPLGSGRQYWSWISEPDWVGAVRHILATPEVSGPVNMASPEPVTNAAFTRALGQVLGRPTLPMPVPKIALTMGIGEFAAAGLLPSHRLRPGKLLDSGYEFTHSDLTNALRAVL